MVEMTEAAAILNGATERSLVLMDEIGRGTSTFDGVALAFAIARHLIEKNRAWTLFSTHYFELTRLAQDYPVCANVHLDAVEHGHKIVFLHAVEEGPASQSYGVQVAALAGMPPAVVREARRRLTLLENREVGSLNQPDLFASAPALPEPPHPALDALRDVNCDELSPREALDKLYQLHKLASRSLGQCNSSSGGTGRRQHGNASSRSSRAFRPASQRRGCCAPVLRRNGCAALPREIARRRSRPFAPCSPAPDATAPWPAQTRAAAFSAMIATSVAARLHEVRRRWQLAYGRGLALGAMHQMAFALVTKRLARSEPAFEAVSPVTQEIEDYHVSGYLVPGTGIEPVWLAPRDFKSLVSTNFTIRARETLETDETLEARPGIEPRYTALQAAVFCSKSITYYAHPPAIRPPQISNIPVCRKSCITVGMIADTGVATLPLLTYCKIWHRREHRFSSHHCRCSRCTLEPVSEDRRATRHAAPKCGKGFLCVLGVGPAVQWQR
jgi:hypothetical protein